MVDISGRRSRFLALMDFSASPYALGDILTWNIRMQIEARNAGCAVMDVAVLADPTAPSNAYQGFINPGNYQKYLLDLFPAFFTNPMLGGFQVYSDRNEFEQLMARSSVERKPYFPDIERYNVCFTRRMGMYTRHEEINRYFKEYGCVPLLAPPKGLEIWAENYLRSFNQDAIVVVVHIRRRDQEVEWIAPDHYRDSHWDEWSRFFDDCYSRFPNVLFILIGRPGEWPRHVHVRANVVPLKMQGYGLLEELTLIQQADLFIGVTSGPAVMAIFGSTPYVVLQQPGSAELSAEMWNIPVGSTMLPFAAENQTIYWGDASAEAVFDQLADKLVRIGKPNMICRP